MTTGRVDTGLTPAEAALYRCEQARPGTTIELTLSPGEALALSSRHALHLNDDEEAVSIAPARGGFLIAHLRETEHGAAMAPLNIKLPPDVALIVLRPANGEPAPSALVIRQDGVKRIVFRLPGAGSVRAKPSARLNALSYLASNSRAATA
ncbi:MAG: hypothetical protein IOC63_09610 [Methylobacterium sp.]|nr:hypothetical protein [Methylobacterium sp.]MCA3637624.1 hypothetical protein [Methylobacterium sp.]MCA3642097.1 hypothetical protein [Methylobacterium sp.]